MWRTIYGRLLTPHARTAGEAPPPANASQRARPVADRRYCWRTSMRVLRMFASSRAYRKSRRAIRPPRFVPSDLAGDRERGGGAVRCRRGRQALRISMPRWRPTRPRHRRSRPPVRRGGQPRRQRHQIWPRGWSGNRGGYADTIAAPWFRSPMMGPGIPEQERQKVFKRFYRLERSRHTRATGWG